MMKKTRVLLTLFAALFLVGTAALAHEEDCHDGLVYDDETFERGYGTASNLKAHFVMRVDPVGVSQLGRLCLCLSTTDSSAVLFDLLIWDDDGPDGGPGTLVGRVENLSAEGIPTSLAGIDFFSWDLSGEDVVVPGSVYVGPAWDAALFPGVSVCADENGSSTQPGYVDIGETAGETAPSTALGPGTSFANYRALGVRAEFTTVPSVRLQDVADLIVSTYQVDLTSSGGVTTFLGVRNTSGEPQSFDVEYHGREVTETPLRTDAVDLDASETWSVSVRSDVTGLDPDGDDLAEGVAFIRRDPSGNLPLAGDYFQVDSDNNFASGERLVRPADFCDLQEIRYANFGSGTELRILLNVPQDDVQPSFSYTVYSEAGAVLNTDDYMTSDHLNLLDVTDLVAGSSFGTVVFDFTNASGGWVSAKYSAFGKFSAEIGSACRD